MAFAAGDIVLHAVFNREGKKDRVAKVEAGRVWVERGVNDNVHFFIPEGGWTGPYADEGKKRAPRPNFDSYSEQVRGSGDTKIWSYYVIDDLLRAIGMKRELQQGSTATYSHDLFEVKLVMKEDNLALIRVLPRHKIPDGDCPLFHFATNDPSAKRVGWLIDHLREEVGKIQRGER